MRDTVSVCASVLKAICIFKFLKVFEPGFLVLLLRMWACVPNQGLGECAS